MVDLTLPEIARALRGLDLPPVDLVVGIARGGVVLATLVAYTLETDLAVLRVNYRDDANRPRHDAPVVLHAPSIPAGTRRVLLVDDVAVSGRTMATARALFDGCVVTTLALKGRADLVLFPEIASCVTVPWSVPADGNLDAGTPGRGDAESSQAS